MRFRLTRRLHLSKVGLKGRHDTSPVRSVLLLPQKNREGLGNIQPTIKKRTQRPAPQYATRGAAQHHSNFQKIPDSMPDPNATSIKCVSPFKEKHLTFTSFEKRHSLT